MSKATDFAYFLTKYLSDYLPGTAGASPNTVSSYRDTFKLFLTFAYETKKIRTEKITLADINKEFVSDFLNWIENERGCCVQTRNNRLTAIHAFFRFVQSQEPGQLFQCQEIISICKKKCYQNTVNFLSEEGIKLLLKQPDPATLSGMKHQVLLSFMYATACRVQEAADVLINDYKFNGNHLVRLTGKGSKSRLVPLEPQVMALIDRYLEERKKDKLYSLNAPLFLNHSGHKLTRQGISAILKKYADMARVQREDLIPKQMFPHMIRHSRSVHWLRAEIDLIYIRDLLGHTSVQTTEVYAKIDSEMKRKALEKASPISYPNEMPAWQSDKSLLEWLKSF